MRPQKVLDNDILDGLTKVFRTKGFEGASLKELAEATGLKKASLYHRFPNGKEEMAEAVLAHVAKRVEESLFQALSNEADPPPLRLKNGLNQIRAIYNYGEEVCIFRALSMPPNLESFGALIDRGMRQWIDAFHHIGVALKLSPAKAEEYALKTLIEIQGSLVVAKGLGDTTIFEEALQKIENRYLKS